MNSQIEDQILLRDIVQLFWLKKPIVLFITGAFLFFSVVIAIISEPFFSSTSKFITKTSSGTTHQFAEFAAMAGINVGTSRTVNPSEYLDIIIKDEKIIKKLVNRKWYYKGDSLYMYDILEIKVDTTRLNWQAYRVNKQIELLRKGDYINITKDKKTSIVTLITQFNDKQLTYDINMFLLELMEKYIITTLKTQASEKRSFIQDRILEIKKELALSEHALQSFRENNTNTSAPGLMIQDMRLMRNVSLNQEVYIQLQKQLEMAKIDEKNELPILEIVYHPELPFKKSGPSRKNILIIGMFLGLMCSVSTIFGMDWLNKNFSNK